MSWFRRSNTKLHLLTYLSSPDTGKASMGFVRFDKCIDSWFYWFWRIYVWSVGFWEKNTNSTNTANMPSTQQVGNGSSNAIVVPVQIQIVAIH